MMVVATLALLSLASAGAPKPNCTGFVTKEFTGMTAGGHFFVGPAVSAAACCSACAAEKQCNAWTYHPNEGHAGCAFSTCATPVSKNAENFGGYRVGHEPDPEKPCHPGHSPSPPPPDPEAPCAATPPSPPAKKGAPNIVLFLMDDMDLMLGSWKAVTKTTKLLTEKGATAKNWMIHTPVCCPSRSELVTITPNLHYAMVT